MMAHVLFINPYHTPEKGASEQLYMKKESQPEYSQHAIAKEMSIDSVPSASGSLEQKQNTKPKRSKKVYLFLCLLLLLGIMGSVLSAISYPKFVSKYHQYLSLAQDAIQHLQTAKTLLVAYPKNPLDTHSISRVKQEFTGAFHDFVLLDSSLESLPGILTYIPEYGIKLRSALDLLPVAIEASRAGIVACDALNLLILRFHDALNSHQLDRSNDQGLTRADLTTIDTDFEHIKSMVYLAVNQINHLPPDELEIDPRFHNLLITARNSLPALLAGLDNAEQILLSAPTLLGIGTPANYLIEVLDSTELRPGGGFIGNIGIVTLSNARLASVQITDVYLLDRPFEAAGKVLPYPPAYTWFNLSPGSWSLRDSNLDADFPTAALYAEQNYQREGGSVSVQGVIAITPALIQHILEITGPINVTEYHEIVTAQNLIARIHYHQLASSERLDNAVSSDGHSSQRKHFTALLARHLMARINQVASTTLPRLVQLFFTSLRSKDIQIYLNSAAAEQFLQRLHLDAAIQSPPIGDSLLVVDANISPNKANNFIINTLNDQVTIDTQGNALHRTTISYAWTINGPIYGSSLYRDYIRVYLPPESILDAQSGWQPMGTGKAFGRTVWAGFFILTFGQTRTITLIWMTPHATIKDAFGWQYQYLIQRQAGSQWTVHVQVTLPPCANITRRWGGLVSHDAYTATLTQSLDQDMSEGIAYAC